MIAPQAEKEMWPYYSFFEVSKEVSCAKKVYYPVPSCHNVGEVQMISIRYFCLGSSDLRLGVLAVLSPISCASLVSFTASNMILRLESLSRGLFSIVSTYL